MNRRVVRTEAIVLRRTNFGEADRILNIITPDLGRLSALAKGVRRPKSKLAGGLELFAATEITVLEGRGEMGTLTSARLLKFYSAIIGDYDRLQAGALFIKLIARSTETVAERPFYELLKEGFEFLNDKKLDIRGIELWFRLQLLNLLGVGINLSLTTEGERLAMEKTYEYDMRNQGFVAVPRGSFAADHIKVLRLANTKNPCLLQQVQKIGLYYDTCLNLLRKIEN